MCVCVSLERERDWNQRETKTFGGLVYLVVFCFVGRPSQGKPPKPVATPRHSPPPPPPYHTAPIRMVPRRRTTLSHEPTTTTATSRHDSGTAGPNLPIGSSLSLSSSLSSSASSRWWNAQMTRRSTKRRIPRIGAWMALVVVCGIQWYGVTQVVWFLENDTTTSSTTTTLVRPRPRSKQPPSWTRSAVMSRAPPHSQSQSQPQAVSFSDSHPHPLTGLLANNTNHNTNHMTRRIRLVYWNGREESWFDDPSEESSSTRSPPGSNDWSIWESLSQRLVSQDVTVERGGSTRTTTKSSLHHHVSLSSGERRTTTNTTTTNSVGIVHRRYPPRQT